MIRALIPILVFSAAVLAQDPKAQLEMFRRETPGLQAAVNDVINSTAPGMSLLQSAKAAYLEGFGVVITLEASLEPPRNPFSSVKTPAEVRSAVTERRKIVTQKLEALLKQRTGGLQSLGPSESLAVVVHLFNSNPADLPDLPSQVVFSVKKQDPTRVSIREF